MLKAHCRRLSQQETEMRQTSLLPVRSHTGTWLRFRHGILYPIPTHHCKKGINLTLHISALGKFRRSLPPTYSGLELGIWERRSSRPRSSPLLMRSEFIWYPLVVGAASGFCAPATFSLLSWDSFDAGHAGYHGPTAALMCHSNIIIEGGPHRSSFCCSCEQRNFMFHCDGCR